MAGTLEHITDWSKLELRDTTTNLICLVVISLVSLFISVIVGWFAGDEVKKVVLSILMTLDTFYIFAAILIRFPFGAGLTYAIRVLFASEDRTSAAEAVRTYFWSVAAVGASLIAGKFLLFLIPLHNNPINGFLIIPLVGLATFHAIWREGGGWWPLVVGTMVIGMIVYILVTSFYPTVKPYVQAASESLRDPMERTQTTTVVNPTDPDILVQKIDDENFFRVDVVVRPDKHPLATPFMKLPMCLPTRKFWYDTFPRHPDVEMVIRNPETSKVWEINTGDYPEPGQPLPIILTGKLQIRIESEGQEAQFQIRCIT